MSVRKYSVDRFVIAAKSARHVFQPPFQGKFDSLLDVAGGKGLQDEGMPGYFIHRLGRAAVMKSRGPLALGIGVAASTPRPVRRRRRR